MNPRPVDADIDYACKENCDLNRFLPFSGQAVHLEVEPTGEMTQVFYNVDPTTLVTKPLVLKKTVVVSGSAPGVLDYLHDENILDRDIKASFADIIAIPLINNKSFLSPRIQISKAHLTRSGFRLKLLSDLAYMLVLNPFGHLDRAPIHLSLGLIANDAKRDFVFAYPQITFTGRVISDDTDVFSRETKPMMQARVMQGSRLISSVANIARDGKFYLDVANPFSTELLNQPITLVVEPIDVESPLPHIYHKLNPNMLRADCDIGDINLGTLKKPISVTIDVHGSDDSTIGNAFLYLKAKVGAGDTLVKKQVDSSGTTNFTALYEGIYDIAVVPPSESKFAMRVIKAVEFDSKDNTEFSIDLQKREPLNAVVVGPTSQPVSGAQIEFSRIGEAGNLASEDIYDDMLFKLTASTNDDGKICHRKFGFNTYNRNDCDSLLLDEGRYLAHIIPPAGTELSHKWFTFDFPMQKELSVSLDQPEILSGQILSADNNPARRAFITVYLAQTDSHNQPKMIGNAITDDQGFFRAFVSAP